MSGYQFAHMELYSAKGKSAAGPEDHHAKRKNGQRAWTAQEIIDELERLEHASRHVIRGRPAPEIIPGDVDNFPDLRAAQIAAASIKESFPYTKKDGSKATRQRKLRADAPSIYASVVSLPVRTEHALADDELRAQSVALLNKSIEHEKKRIEKAGGRFMMGVIHWDEEHLHAHIIALDPVRGRVKHLHPGHAAKDDLIQEGKDRKLSKKEVNKLGNRAYCDAMRAWQDDFHSAVFQKAGLLRYGPRRGRLTRAEYRRAKESAMMRAADEEWRSEIESAMASAEEMKEAAAEEIERGRTMRATATERVEALEFGTASVLSQEIVYRPKKKEKPEGLAFGPNAPSSKKERTKIAGKRAKVGDALRGGISWRCSDAVNSLVRKGYATCQRLPSPNCPIHRVFHPTHSRTFYAMARAS
ncbi:hypothetical protein [uncultured Roseovarius sp.]|uniref:hypothetical protein n=1 Tax=uncultured Roseovarius sp. TaxID=293344 RepID=UPI00262AAA38|nr:hypothetical protein [uncultured Roseovarius sp.]